jgi:3'(2'), 5'-bisphosphate nucleotidase
MKHELETARTIALEAAALVRTFQRRGIHVDKKAGDEPVTEADRAASALIVERLRAAFPSDAILSEELPDDGSRLRNRRAWMVDPIDGTRDFINGDDGFAVMIGLVVDGRPVVGVVSQPPTGITWAGAVGVDAWRETADGVRSPLRPSTLAQPSGIRLVASKSHRTRDVDRFREKLGIADELNVGGVGLKVGLVADGSRDLYVYPGSRTKLWDTAAPEAILVAAGGRLSDVRGQLIPYDVPELRNLNGIVASNGPLHEAVIGALAELKTQVRS